MKCVCITGGVYSGLGKWIASASIATIIKAMWHSVTMVKMDPYLQIDAGTMSPYEHGECYVTDDGGETDLDIGNYERYIGVSLTKENNITSGKVYQAVIDKERRGDYLWQTVQVVPHIVEEIKQQIQRCGVGYEVVIVEVGGTVWDIESPAFYEAMRQLKRELGDHGMCYVHLAPIVRIPHSGEMKTKPLQHSVKALRETGIIPDVLLCRTDATIDDGLMKKIANATDIDADAVIQAPNVESIYEVPLRYADQGMHEILAKKLSLSLSHFSLDGWGNIVDMMLHPARRVTIAMAGKYTHLPECYHSVLEALKHAGAAENVGVRVVWIDTDALESQGDMQAALQQRVDDDVIDAMIIPWWFGGRGVEGMIEVARYCREKNMPMLWICLGLQVSVIEFLRNVCGYPRAWSMEFDPTCKEPAIAIMEDQKLVMTKWGTMRLGLYPAQLSVPSLAFDLYGTNTIHERHRHRYEVNPLYHELLEQGGMKLSGMSPDRLLVEFIELPQSKHPYFIATQAHPEFLSRVEKPHPLFVGLVRSAKELHVP
jgi:CTP synthase